jgi:hypothetical protein
MGGSFLLSVSVKKAGNTRWYLFNPPYSTTSHTNQSQSRRNARSTFNLRDRRADLSCSPSSASASYFVSFSRQMNGLEVLSCAIPLPSPPPAAPSTSADGAAIASASNAPSSSNAAGPSSSSGGASSTATRVPGYQPVKTQTEGATVKRSAKVSARWSRISVISSLTLHGAQACLYCRKGKAKCDGLSNSWPCRRCR